MKKIDKLAIAGFDGTTILHLDNKDIELIVRLLHQELDAVSDIIERNQNQDINWLDRADHCEDLIIQLLR